MTSLTILSGVLCQFTLGVTEEQQDMIPPTSKSLRQRRCGHCLLQVSCPPCQRAAIESCDMWNIFTTLSEKNGWHDFLKQASLLMDSSPHVLYVWYKLL